VKAKRIPHSKLPKRTRKRAHKRKKNPAYSSPFAHDLSSMMLARGIGLLLDVLAPVGGFGPYPKTYGPMSPPPQAPQAPESRQIDPSNVVTLHQTEEGEYST
jgi:hypothetical protein